MDGDGSIASRTKMMCSPCQGGASSGKDQPNQGHRDLGPDLPKDIWWHIHSVLPLIDAARLACVSQDFLWSWRFCPNITLTPSGFNIKPKADNDDQIRYFINIADSILKNHSGVGIKTFKLDFLGLYIRADYCSFDHLDSWLQIVVKPGIEELGLGLPYVMKPYNIPCTLFTGGTGASLRSLMLRFCKFQPRVGLCLGSLTRLHFTSVRIDEDSLRCLLSSVPSLESLFLNSCYPIVCIQIPCLYKLSHLNVSYGRKLQLIESKAPNLLRFYFSGKPHVRFSLASSQRIEELKLLSNDAISYACSELPSIVPNLRTLTLSSRREEPNAPMMTTKFVHLKFLSIETHIGRDYDLSSLLYFLLACPLLETFIFSVHPLDIHPSVFSDNSGLRTMAKHHHDKLKSVRIDTFYSAKMLVEFTCQIVESAMALKFLTLDTTCGYSRRSPVNTSGKCFSMTEGGLVEARRSVLAVNRYIKPKLLSTVELNVVGPCDRCHAAER